MSLDDTRNTVPSPENTPDDVTPVQAQRGDHLQYLLTAYLFESISEEGRREVETHLEGCAECRDEMQVLRRTLGLLHGALEDGQEESYSFDERRRARVLAAAARKRGRIMSFVMAHPGVGAAAALLVVLSPVVMIVLLSQMRMSEMKSSGRRLVGDYSATPPMPQFEADSESTAATRGMNFLEMREDYAGGSANGTRGEMAGPQKRNWAARGGEDFGVDGKFDFDGEGKDLVYSARPRAPAPALLPVESSDEDESVAVVDAPAEGGIRVDSPEERLIPTVGGQVTRRGRSSLQAKVAPPAPGRPELDGFSLDVSRPAQPATEPLSTPAPSGTTHAASPQTFEAELRPPRPEAARAENEESPSGNSVSDNRKGGRDPGFNKQAANVARYDGSPGGGGGNITASRAGQGAAGPAPPGDAVGAPEDPGVTDAIGIGGGRAGAYGERFSGAKNKKSEVRKELAQGGVPAVDDRAEESIPADAQGLRDLAGDGLESLGAGLDATAESAETAREQNPPSPSSREIRERQLLAKERVSKLNERLADEKALQKSEEFGASDRDYNTHALGVLYDQALGPKGKVRPQSDVVEKFFAAYDNYRARDPKLDFDDFVANPRAVPAPGVGDEGLGREAFRQRYGTNPFVETGRDRESTFAMEVDTASFTRARSVLAGGRLPPPESVRVEEFVNYIRQDYPTDPAEVFAVHCDGSPSPFAPPEVELLRIGIKARELAEGERQNAVLTFAIDVSGSMAMARGAAGTSNALPPQSRVVDSRLELVKQSVRVLLGELAPTDQVALVSFASQATLVLPHTPARHAERIEGALESLFPQGGTNVEAGLDLAYRLADDALSPGSAHRVILVSDGVANIGARDPDEILAKVRVFAQRGVYLSIYGVGGQERFNDDFLERLTNEGNGKYDYIDTLDEARRLFVEHLPANLAVLARDAKIQVVFEPEAVSRYRLLGYENRDIKDEDFRNDRVDAGEVGPGSTVTALYEIVRERAWSGPLGKVYVRYFNTRTQQVEERNYPIPVGVIASERASAAGSLRLVTCAAEIAELLRHSYYSRDGSFGDVLAELSTLDPETRSRPEFRDLHAMASRARDLRIATWSRALEVEVQVNTEKGGR